MTARCPTCDREGCGMLEGSGHMITGETLTDDDENAMIDRMFAAAGQCNAIGAKIWRARALAAEARIATVTATIEHDIAVCRGHQAARATGGQTCGTGGALTAAQPSMLAYLERAVRDLRDTTDRAAALELKP